MLFFSGGYTLLWVLFWSTVIGNVLQILAARMGVVTGKNMAELCRETFPWGISMTLWIMTEIAIITSDIQEVIGSVLHLCIPLLFRQHAISSRSYFELH
jgi:NRAMP (natural resistance-associated macrophage protein)-like metal ion transporter